ncbi:MAG: response regulator transcription factor, partial [Planctomycetaceae bacterium]
MTRVLIVEDEDSIRDAVTFMLRREGYEVRAVPDGNAAMAAFLNEGTDLILLDLMLPGMSGTELCQTIRKTSQVPIIMLTAKDAEIDKVVGLELGADDYVTKPFSTRELTARIKAVLRRGYQEDSAPDDESVITAGPVRIDVERHEVTINDEPINLPLKEFDLLALFARNAGRVLTRAQLIER